MSGRDRRRAQGSRHDARKEPSPHSAERPSVFQG